MKISIFTDEINRENPSRAIELAAAWGVTHVEVRSLPGGRFPTPADGELEAFHARIRDAGLAISAVSPGFFKCSVHDPSVEKGLAEDLPRACAWTRRWGTDMISCFAFTRGPEEEAPAVIVDRLGEMADIARREGCRMVLENEAGCWGGTGLEAAAIIRRVGADRIGLCWDPGNSAKAGATCPYPDEYDTLKDLVVHVHVKNYDTKTGGWMVAESGLVDWPGQFEALKRDRYGEFVVVETHLTDVPAGFEVDDPTLIGREANSFRNLAFVRRCLGV